MPQFWCFAISVQCVVQFPHFVFFSVLHHTTHLVLVVLQTSLGRHPRAGMLCVTSIETVMWFDSGSLFLSCELAASIVSRDNVDGVGENISGCARP